MMPEGLEGSVGGLPVVSDKVLSAMNQLMAEKDYRIKPPISLFHSDRTDFVNSEFVLYTLNDYLGHLQQCVAATKKMMPDDNVFGSFREYDEVSFRLITLVREINIRQLSILLTDLQADAHAVSVSRLVPFVRLLFLDLIRVYYLGAEMTGKKYRSAYSFIQQVSGDNENRKAYTTSAILEWQYIFDKIYPGLYPLVLRMCSTEFFSMHQLYYANGSKILSWLELSPSDILIVTEKDLARQEKKISVPVAAEAEAPEPVVGPPDAVLKGMQFLDRLFPEAGWLSLETMPDLCPYFLPILDFQDAFIQLAPDNPLQQTLVLLRILEEMFQGLRLVRFESLEPLSSRDDVEDIYKIFENWIEYQEEVFDKTFSADFKAYTHQVYTQPDFRKNPYGRKLLSNMYTLIKSMFLPHFDISLYGSARMQKDDRLPPLYTRVSRLRRLLDRYNAEIQADSIKTEKDPEASIPGILNPWAPYKFDIANTVSTRLDALLGGRHARNKTNAELVECTLSVVNVLDWWLNDKNSYAYQASPKYLYRVIESGSSVPAFGVKARTDIDAVFAKHLKAQTPLTEV
jgi:hypothetical protein